MNNYLLIFFLFSGYLFSQHILPLRERAKLIDEIQKEFNASVSGIGANVDPVSQTIQLKGTITNASPALLPGMSGRVVF